MQYTALPDVSGSVCRYSPPWRAVSFALAFAIGLIASYVQIVAVGPSQSAALLGESIHAFSDSIILLPATLASLLAILPALGNRARSWQREEALASLMASLMIVAGILVVGFAFKHLLLESTLDADAGVGPALFGLGANVVQLLLIIWCGRCRLHNLSKSHLFIDSASSVSVSAELAFDLNRAWGLPVDALLGIVLGLLLIRSGLRGGRSHTHSH